MFTVYLAGLSAVVILIVLRAVVKRLTSKSISHLRGPKPDSWLVGSLSTLRNPENLGDAECAWTKEFGNTLAYKGVMGKDLFMTADPKALQYIFHTGGYNFPKPNSGREFTALIMGRGLIWAEGAQHVRHRRVMDQAFSFGVIRRFLPVFRHMAQRMVVKLKQEFSKSNRTTNVIDFPPWLHRTSLDAIGIAGFDYEFGAIAQESENKLAKAYGNLFADTFAGWPDSMLVWEDMIDRIPVWMTRLLHSLPFDNRLKKLNDYMKLALGVAKEILDRQTALHATGKEGSTDVMSILIRANLAENPKEKLAEEEVLSQLTTLLMSGHETTANTLTWVFHELSRHPEYQTLVRDEIKAARRQASQRGDDELSIADLDSMKYLGALLKETLRLYPISPTIERESGREDVIPLSTPIITKKGETVNFVPIPAKQKIIISVVAYNKLKSIWGDDADVWRPERFMDGTIKPDVNLGLLANLASFAGGVRGCIGWKFALVQMQTILMEVLEAFEFSPPPGNVEIRVVPAGVVVPMIKGSTDKHSRLPLTITSI